IDEQTPSLQKSAEENDQAKSSQISSSIEEKSVVEDKSEAQQQKPSLDNVIEISPSSNESRVKDDHSVKDKIVVTEPSAQLQVLTDTYPWYTSYSQLIQAEDKLSLISEQLSKTLDSISQTKQIVEFEPEPHERLSTPDYDRNVLHDTSATLEKVHELAEISTQITKAASPQRDEIQTQQQENNTNISVVEDRADDYAPVTLRRKRTMSPTEDDFPQTKSSEYRDEKPAALTSDIDLKPVATNDPQTLALSVSEVTPQSQSLSSEQPSTITTKSKKNKKKQKKDKDKAFSDASQSEILHISVTESNTIPASASQQTSSDNVVSMQSYTQQQGELDEVPSDISSTVKSVNQEIDEFDEQLKPAQNETSKIEVDVSSTNKTNETNENEQYQQQSSIPDSETEQSSLKTIQQTVVTPFLAVGETIQKMISNVAPSTEKEALTEESQSAALIQADDHQTDQGSVFSNLKDSFNSTLFSITNSAFDILQSKNNQEEPPKAKNNENDMPKLEEQKKISSDKKSKKNKRQKKEQRIDLPLTSIILQDNQTLSEDKSPILLKETNIPLSPGESKDQIVNEKDASVTNENLLSQSNIHEKTIELSQIPVHYKTSLENVQGVSETEQTTVEHKNQTSLALDNKQSKLILPAVEQELDDNEQIPLLSNLKNQISSTISTTVSSVIPAQDSKDEIKKESDQEKVSPVKEKKHKKNKKQKKEPVSELSTDQSLSKEELILPPKVDEQQLASQKVTDTIVSPVSADPEKTMDTPISANETEVKVHQHPGLIEIESKTDGHNHGDEMITTTNQIELPSSENLTDASLKKSKKKRKKKSATKKGSNVESNTTQDLSQSDDEQNDDISISKTNIETDETKSITASSISHVSTTQTVKPHSTQPTVQSTTSTILEQSPDYSPKSTTTDDSEWTIQRKKLKAPKNKNGIRPVPSPTNVSSIHHSPPHRQLPEKVTDMKIRINSNGELTVMP
ncbi:unnamed protein product, partial [Didymodactylos carnosus]